MALPPYWTPEQAQQVSQIGNRVQIPYRWCTTWNFDLISYLSPWILHNLHINRLLYDISSMSDIFNYLIIQLFDIFQHVQCFEYTFVQQFQLLTIQVFTSDNISSMSDVFHYLIVQLIDISSILNHLIIHLLDISGC